MTFADKIISFNKNLDFKDSLPAGINIMNPFKDNPSIIEVSSMFYRKFYNDNNSRHLILGINPGRFGAGVTGVPFTDTKRMNEKCGITIPGFQTHEPSSVFVYEVIEAYGGVEKFYSEFYINSVCPLGFTSKGNTSKEVNYNYYDSKELTAAVKDFILKNIQKQLELPIKRDVCFCLGAGKNFEFLNKLNLEYQFFERIVPLDHPRFVMQYKSKQKQVYINKYVDLLKMK
ncbi:MAG: uracil-DNA glycosylase family protein [Tenuifilaceae bacterium]